MSRLKIAFFACALGSVLNLSVYASNPTISPPKSKGEPHVRESNPGKAPLTKPQITVTDAEGQILTAKKENKEAWSVKGMDLEGTITIDPEAGSANFQSTSKDAPLQSVTVTVNGNIITTLQNSKGQQRIATASPDGYTEQVDVTNPSGNTVTAIRSSEGVWKISGTDISGKTVKGILAIDPNTRFVAYKGTNGAFMYKKNIPVEFVVAGMASAEKPITNEVAAESFVDNKEFPDVPSAVRVQVNQLVSSVLEKDGTNQ